jgi:ribonuclease J
VSTAAPATLACYGGVDEIGGNKFLLQAGRTRVLLDMGLSFGAAGTFFTDFLGPRRLNGLGDWWTLGLLPRMEGVYRQDYLDHMGLPKEERALDGVLLSHAHLDHIGDLHFLREDIPLLASPGSLGVLQALEDTSASGLSEYLHLEPSFRIGPSAKGGLKRLGNRDLPPIARPTMPFGPNAAKVGDVEVRGVAEDHSLPGAAGILVEAATTRLAYTGDFRFHGRHGSKSEAFVRAARDFEPHYLLVEGTRVEAEAQPSEADVAQELAKVIGSVQGLMMANWPVRDTDRLLTFWEACNQAGRQLCISIKQAAILERLRAAGEDELPSLDDPHLRIYVPRKGWGLLGRDGVPRDLALQDYAVWERDYVDHPRAVTAAEIRASPREFVVRIDFFDLKELIDLQPPEGSLYFRSTTEPFNLEMELDEKVAQAWLAQFKVPYVHKHASGHASGPELWKAIAAIAPRVVVPIHTQRVDLFAKALEPLGIAVQRPTHMLKAGGKPLELRA